VRIEPSLPRLTLLLASALCAVLLLGAGSAHAESSWRLEQPDPPPAEAGVPEATGPIGLGKVGDIEFFSPNLGALITAGVPPTIPPSVWLYNGQGWHEIAKVCGATDGRIAWVSASEFWTISDGRPGQAEVNFKIPPTTDNTLCRFADGKVVESFAAPAFEADSYMAMHAAACVDSEDCWFGGDSLPSESTETGAFQLHWTGSGLIAAPYPEEGHAIEDMREFDGRLFESVRLLEDDPGKQVPVPPALHMLEPELPGGFEPERRLRRETLYGTAERPWSLDYLHLAAGTDALWAAAGQRPEASEQAQVTVLRFDPEDEEEWTQVLGPSTSPSAQQDFPNQTVEAVAAEPGGGEESAWIALQSLSEGLESERGKAKASTPATVARISEDGVVLQEETLPGASEGGLLPKGAAYKLACPASGDCWLVTTKGWLFHLAPEDERTLPANTETSFTSLITERPADQGLPQTTPDSVPVDDSGLPGEEPVLQPIPTVSKAQEELFVPVALVSALHSRVVHGTMLELRFHLAVKARIQLLAKRKHRVVAKTPAYTLKAGEHKLLLRLNRAHWPTELHLVEHALAPLPKVSTRTSGAETVSTSLAFPKHLGSDWSGLLP
jgi:hypothetical protein